MLCQWYKQGPLLSLVGVGVCSLLLSVIACVRFLCLSVQPGPSAQPGAHVPSPSRADKRKRSQGTRRWTAAAAAGAGAAETGPAATSATPTAAAGSGPVHSAPATTREAGQRTEEDKA
eukprot:1159504-Pelagomonas_calceolata.AAC.11